MRINIISNNNCDTSFSVTDEVVPCVGDEVIWEVSSPRKNAGKYSGTVNERTIDYTQLHGNSPDDGNRIVTTRTDIEVTLDMKNVEPIFNVG